MGISILEVPRIETTNVIGALSLKAFSYKSGVQFTSLNHYGTLKVK